MKKYCVISCIVAIVVAVAICAALCCRCCRTAVVNVDQIVASSSDVAELRTQRQHAITEMQKFANDANADIDKQKDEKKKEELRDKYAAELAAKQQQEQQEYTKRLQEIDDHITTLIKETAKQEGFKVVLNKAVVVSGGTDITDLVLRKLNQEK